MSAATMPPPASKPTTRASLRQTLTLASASMGKALSDAIHKDHGSEREKERMARKAREKEKDANEERSARRASTIAARPAARPALDSSAPEAPAPKLVESVPTTRRVTRSQKVVASSSEESGNQSGTASVRTSETRTTDTSVGVALPDAAAPASGTEKAAGGRSLRPRTAAGSAVTTSALPKYRPRSVLVDATTASAAMSVKIDRASIRGDAASVKAENTSAKLLKPSPARPAHRRKLTNDDGSDTSSDDASVSVNDTSARPISPLPRRAAHKPISSVTNASASGSTRASGVPRTTSPVRQPATKAMRKSPVAAASMARPPSTASARPPSTASARPPSTVSQSPASGSAVRIQQTKSAPRSLRDVFGMVRGSPAAPKPPKRAESPAAASGKPAKATAALIETPSVQRPPRAARPTPVSVSSRTDLVSARSPGSSGTATPTKGRDKTNDSFDVERMLAPASSAGPTPAMPRTLLGPQYTDPATPSRHPGANSSSYAPHLAFTPQGPSNGDSPGHMRPSPGRAIPHDPRSWTLDQLAAVGSLSLGLEAANLLTDTHAPFSMLSSPMPSTSRLAPMESPMPSLGYTAPLDSPMMSASSLPSPLSQSISGILLPQVTPSIVPRRELFEVGHAPSESPRPGFGQSPPADLMMLRLQLAKAESDVYEHTASSQALEAELAARVDAHTRELRLRDTQIADLEDQLQRALDASARVDDLTGALALAEARRVEDITAARAAGSHAAQQTQAQAFSLERARWRAAHVADAAAARWAMVMDGAEAELAFVENAKETLAVLRASLACLQITSV